MAQIEHLVATAGGSITLLERESAKYSGRRAISAAVAMSRGGAPPRERLLPALGPGDIVHAHNVHPTFGWRTLAKLRSGGAAVVLHLHNYRLFCATGVAFRDGADCFACAPRRQLEGVRHNCRGNRGQAVAYATGIGLWQQRLLEQADVVVAPCRALLDDLGRHDVLDRGEVLPNWVSDTELVTGSRAGDGAFALIVTRAAPEKGVEVAIRAAREAGMRLVVAGDGPSLPELRSLAARIEADVEFVGAVGAQQLAKLRSGAAFAVVPSLWREVQPFAALESLAAGLPLVASDVPALRELTEAELLFERGDVAALAAIMRRLDSGRQALADLGERALVRAREAHSSFSAATRLATVYALAVERRAAA